MSKYGKKVIVVLCGGDGSFMGILEELKDYGIDIENIIFTQFPFGTANDVSSAFGWGRVPSKKMLNNLFYRYFDNLWESFILNKKLIFCENFKIKKYLKNVFCKYTKN